MRFPSADQIAVAIVEACKLTGDGPIATCMRQKSRGRHIAYAALCEVFPDARRERLGRCCGYPTPKSAPSNLHFARRASWWRDDWVDEVVGALVAETYGDQAE